MGTRRRAPKKVNKRLVAIIGAIFAVLVVVTMLLIRANQPRQQAKNEAIQIAKQQTNLKTVENFYWFNREKTYFTVVGQDAEGKELAVIIPKSDQQIHVVKLSEGLSEKSARDRVSQEQPDLSIKQAALGLFEDQAVWEVTGKAANGSIEYYLLSFKDGQTINVIKGS
ncbi:peptidase [Enterococcus florum]|uniref:Peptidase n=1 Tax=Enterococcus florum TaxID=2480627 RepID=A0A4P5P515_9ENTE|nr:DUF5590 domain-containing protein [Enterococcus florum]GCF92915.1 peptidase [Enterococcus florum]